MFKRLKKKLQERAFSKGLKMVAKVAPSIAKSDVKVTIAIKALELLMNYFKAVKKEMEDGVDAKDFLAPVDSLEDIKTLLK